MPFICSEIWKITKRGTKKQLRSTIYYSLNSIKNAKWLAEKGMVLNNLAKYKEAKEVLLEAINLDSENGYAYSALLLVL